MKNKQDLSQLSINDLREKIAEETGTLRKMKLSHAVSPNESPIKIRYTRRGIARLNTELRKREINEQSKTK